MLLTSTSYLHLMIGNADDINACMIKQGSTIAQQYPSRFSDKLDAIDKKSANFYKRRRWSLVNIKNIAVDVTLYDELQ